MYRGTLSSFLDNTFKYHIKTNDLPLKPDEKSVSGETTYLDIGTRSISIEIETEDELVFVRSKRMNLVIEIPCKMKFILENVTIRKRRDCYILQFYSVMRNRNL